MHLTGSPHGPAVDGDHRACEAVAALPDEASIQSWVGRFALLADPTRLTLLLCIHAAGEICVSDLAAAAGLKDTTTSQALRLLRAQGMVTARRTGRVVHYHLADDTAHELLHRVARPAETGPSAP